MVSDAPTLNLVAASALHLILVMSLSRGIHDKELEGVLAEGELTERKAAVAEEILRRRQDAKAEAIKEKNGWIGGILATLALILFGLRRFWRKRFSG